MMWTIIKKEMLTNVTSLRFALTLLLVMMIFIVSGFVFVGKYRYEMTDFRNISNGNLSRLEAASKNLSHIPNYFQMIRRRPKLAQLCCDGFEKSLPNTFMVNALSISRPDIVSRTNFFFPSFADVDWAFIISLLLSFVAFLITFDSLSAERERGTLSLVMSNPIPRDKVIMGKYVAAMLTLMIPLFVGLLLNLIIVGFSGLSLMHSGQWTRILMFVGVSILYLSIFILLGILVSTRSAKSSSSIVVLLFIWVTMAMIIPSAGRIIAETFVKVPTHSEVDRQIKEVQDEIWENSDRYGKNAGNWGGDLSADWINPPARARLYNALADSENRIREEHLNKMVAQVSLGRNITRISPTVIYQCASEAIVGTGVVRFRSLYDQLKRYKGILKEFVLAADRKDPNSYHLLTKGHGVLLSQRPVDYNSIPKFEEKDVRVSSALGDAMWNIGALALLNILLFMGVYASFLRSPVK